MFFYLFFILSLIAYPSSLPGAQKQPSQQTKRPPLPLPPRPQPFTPSLAPLLEDALLPTHLTPTEEDSEESEEEQRLTITITNPSQKDATLGEDKIIEQAVAEGFDYLILEEKTYSKPYNPPSYTPPSPTATPGSTPGSTPAHTDDENSDSDLDDDKLLPSTTPLTPPALEDDTDSEDELPF